MSGTSVWEARCAVLGDALVTACASVLPGAELRIAGRPKTMFAEEEDPNVAPYYPIGAIYRFRLQERRTRHLFGWKRLPWRSWNTLAGYGMEEMWNAPRWTTEQGLRCYVHDGRVAAAVMPILERFAHDHGLLFRAAWPQKDP